jgi:5-methylcytosine-specific restriction endonuclease McrA
MSGTKCCSKCKAWKWVEDFYVWPRAPDGYSWKCRLCTRNQVKEWRRRNREYVLAYTRKQYARWAKAHPGHDQGRYLRRQLRLRDAGGGSFNRDRKDYAARIAFFGGRCAYCRGPYEALDHSIPISRGGSNHPANIRPVCRSCNQSKHTKTPVEFAAWRVKNMLEDGQRQQQRG